MIRNKLGRLAMTSLLGVALLTTAACSNNGGSDSPAGGSSGTIEVWDYLGQGVSDTAMKAVVEAFEEKHPDIKVNRTSFAFADLSKSIVQGGVGGQVPDVAIVDVVDNQNFAALGLLQDHEITAARHAQLVGRGDPARTRTADRDARRRAHAAS